MVFLLTKNPYTLHYKPLKGKQPDIELFDVKNYEILTTGIDSIVLSKKVEKYKDYDQFYNIDVLYKDNLNLIDSLLADKAILKNNILYLSDNVKYTRSDNLALNSNRVQYDIGKKIISSNDLFELIKNNVKTTGNSFTYQMQKGIIEAYKVKSIIRTEK